MSRRRVMKEIEEDIVQEAEVVMKWSRKRIVIATTLVVVIILGGLYTLSLLSQRPKTVLGSTSDKPQIKIPTDNNIEEVIEKAQEDLSKINARNIIQSQPKIQKIIDDLTSITNSSGSAKELICNAICK